MMAKSLPGHPFSAFLWHSPQPDPATPFSHFTVDYAVGEYMANKAIGMFINTQKF